MTRSRVCRAPTPRPAGLRLAAVWAACALVTLGASRPAANVRDGLVPSAAGRIIAMERAREAAIRHVGLPGSGSLASGTTTSSVSGHLRDVQAISRDRLIPESGANADTEVEPDIAADPQHH